jgi:DNA-binding HxlR family transcriptional regulator
MANRWERSERVIGLIDGRWMLAVLAELRDGGRRYQELDDALDGVSHKVLTRTYVVFIAAILGLTCGNA